MSFANHNGTGRPQGRKHNKHEDEEAGKVFVGGLSWETTQDNLLRYFSRYGEVIDCVVMKNAETGRSRGFGFVTFSDPSNIDSVIENCPHTLDGRTIDPKPCNPRSMQKPKKNTVWPKVFLGGLPSSITETDLRAFFVRYGEVMEVVIMYDQEKKKARGFGFLSFNSEDAVDRAVNDHYVNIQNKQVEIKRAEPRTSVTELTNGPVVDQWGAATAAAPNGVHSAPHVTPTYSGWGAPAGPPPATQNFTQPAYTVGPSHWGSPPATQPSHGWGAPPPVPPQPHNAYPTITPSQPLQYSNHYISPAPNHQTPSHTFTASYWGSPPGPTPPPSTPQEIYSPHAASPQSPQQPKFDMSLPGAFHLHPAPAPGHAPAPPDFARMYPKPAVNAAPPAQYTTAATPEYYSSPVVAYAAAPDQGPRLGTLGTAYVPPQISNYHPYRRT